MVSVIIAGVLGAAITAGIYQSINAAMKSQALISAGTSLNVLNAQIQGLLSNPQTCAYILQDKDGNPAKFNPDNVLPANPSPADQESFKKENTIGRVALGKMVLTVDNTYSNGVYVLSHNLSEVNKTLRKTSTQDSTSILETIAILNIQAEKRTAPNSSGMPVNLNFPIDITLDMSAVGTNKFMTIKCSLASGMIGQNQGPATATVAGWGKVATAGDCFAGGGATCDAGTGSTQTTSSNSSNTSSSSTSTNDKGKPDTRGALNVGGSVGTSLNSSSNPNSNANPNAFKTLFRPRGRSTASVPGNVPKNVPCPPTADYYSSCGTAGTTFTCPDGTVAIPTGSVSDVKATTTTTTVDTCASSIVPILCDIVDSVWGINPNQTNSSSQITSNVTSIFYMCVQQ